jgi:predicted metal-dependent phosphoesterase TrpH
MAHPGLTRMDELIPALRAAGLAALEAVHPDHDRATEHKYRAMAAHLGLAVSGGSDFHGEDRNHRSALAGVVLPPPDFQQLLEHRA